MAVHLYDAGGIVFGSIEQGRRNSRRRSSACRRPNDHGASVPALATCYTEPVPASLSSDPNARATALQRVTIALTAGLLLYCLFSVYRHALIPGDADPARAAALLTGDEPAYLLMAQAIARGDGLDVEPANAAETYLAFQQRPVFRFEDHFRRSYYEGRGFRPLWRGAAVWKEGRITQFSPLLPALLAPVVATARRIRWATCVAQGAFVAVCVAAIILGLNAAAGRAGTGHAAAALVFGLGGIPAGYYASQVFPEVLSGLLLLLFLFTFASPRRPVRLLGLFLLLAPLWATPRVVGGVAAATAVIVWRQRAKPRRAELALLGAGWACYFVFNTLVWGNPLPPQGSALLYGLWQALRGLPLPLLAAAAACVAAIAWVLNDWLMKPGNRRRGPALVSAAVALCALAVMLTPPGRRILAGGGTFFFSNNVGLLVLNPFLVVALVAGLALRREDGRGEFPVWIGLIAGLVLSVAGFEESRAGVCPSGRYQVITACALLFAPARVLAERRGRPTPSWVPGMYLLGALSLAVSLAVALRPNFWYRRYHPLFGYDLVRPFYRLLPDPDRWSFLPHAALWLALLLALLFLPAWLRGRGPGAVARRS